MLIFIKAEPSLIDAREKPVTKAQHSSDSGVFGPRAYFRTAFPSPAVLVIDDIKRHDAATYRCRVDFRKGQTRSFRYNLTVIEKNDDEYVDEESCPGTGRPSQTYLRYSKKETNEIGCCGSLGTPTEIEVFSSEKIGSREFLDCVPPSSCGLYQTNRRPSANDALPEHHTPSLLPPTATVPRFCYSKSLRVCPPDSHHSARWNLREKVCPLGSQSEGLRSRVDLEAGARSPKISVRLYRDRRLP
uniref:Uncharacterized protein n=1 Tax=Vespula pensylvanica TaxID=30213 RepID=A0A834NRZ4_VESPE|nr:hypothetical protein H0235_011463 [Vespula pensylvanica]